LVIGLPHIRKFDLTHKLRNHFRERDIDIEATNNKSITTCSALHSLFQHSYELTHVLAATYSLSSQSSMSTVASSSSSLDTSLPKMYGLNTINAAENDIKAVYQKHELLDLLEDDTEVPEWKEDITTFLPPDDSDKLNQSVEDELPKIEGDSDFHNKLLS
jgi:hypothetical protein